MKRLPFTKCVTDSKLLEIGREVMRLPFTKYAMSLTNCGSWGKVTGETSFHKMCNVTHKLLVIGKDVMRLPFTNCAMSLTCCWS